MKTSFKKKTYLSLFKLSPENPTIHTAHTLKYPLLSKIYIPEQSEGFREHCFTHF